MNLTSCLYRPVKFNPQFKRPLLKSSNLCAFSGKSPGMTNYFTQLTNALAKISQLQCLPQVKPDVFKGDKHDKTKFFLCKNALESLINAALVTA